MTLSRRLTLLELLVSVAIVATLAGGLVLAASGTEEHAARHLAERELHELRQAVLAFRRDTGWLPGQGPFAREGEHAEGCVRLQAGVEAWFAAPENLVQLVENPLQPTVRFDDRLAAPKPHALATYDWDTRRGWNGPYLRDEGLLTQDGVSGIPAVADPFRAASAPGWSSRTGRALDLGGPYRLRYLGAPASRHDDRDLSRFEVASAGPNGQWGDPDDLALPLQ